MRSNIPQYRIDYTVGHTLRIRPSSPHVSARRASATCKAGPLIEKLLGNASIPCIKMSSTLSKSGRGPSDKRTITRRQRNDGRGDTEESDFRSSGTRLPTIRYSEKPTSSSVKDPKDPEEASRRVLSARQTSSAFVRRMSAMKGPLQRGRDRESVVIFKMAVARS
jgi:hypothetical protein